MRAAVGGATAARLTIIPAEPGVFVGGDRLNNL